MLSLEEIARLLRRNELATQGHRADQFLDAHVMAHKPLQIIDLEASRPEHLLDEHLWRRNARPLELADHGARRLRNHFSADMNPELLLLLDEQQPMVGVPFDLPARFLSLFIRPIAGREESPQIDLAPSVDKVLLADAFPIDRAEVDHPAAGTVHFGIRREHEDRSEEH